MTQLNLMSEEAEELLREIAADPRSSLMRVPRRGRNGKLLQVSEAGLARAPGRSRSPAERQLAKVQRAEVARVMRAVCRERLANDPESSKLVSEFRADGSIPTRRLHEELSIDYLCWDADLRIAIEMVIDCDKSRASSSAPSTLKLATTALGLCPNPTSRLLVAFSALAEGRLRYSRSLLDAMLSGSSGRERVDILELSGLCWALKGRPGEAYGDFISAYQLGSPRPSSLLSAFVNSLDIGDTSLIRSAASLVDDALTINHPATRHFVSSHIKRRTAGKWNSTEAGRRIARARNLRLGSISSQLTSAYAQ